MLIFSRTDLCVESSTGHIIKQKGLIAQAESGVLAQMQLQQLAEAATAECAALRSQLEAQVAKAAEAQQQHTADLEACKQDVSTFVSTALA